MVVMPLNLFEEFFNLNSYLILDCILILLNDVPLLFFLNHNSTTY